MNIEDIKEKHFGRQIYLPGNIGDEISILITDKNANPPLYTSSKIDYFKYSDKGLEIITTSGDIISADNKDEYFINREK